MYLGAFIGEPLKTESLKPLYLSTCKWAISPILSDQVTYSTSLYTNHIY